MKIGFVGLGVMGSEMVHRLLDQFGQVSVFDVDEKRLAVLSNDGCKKCASAQEVAQNSEVVLLSLPNGQTVLNALSEESGILAGAHPGTIVVDFSTIGPEAARTAGEHCAKHNVTFLDVPVGGGQANARNGSLALLAGGDRAAFDKVTDILEVIGSTSVHFGPSGAGQAAKLALNLAYGVLTCGAAESSNLLSRFGVDRQKMVTLFDSLPVNSWFAKPLVDDLAGAHEAGFQTDLMLKDMRLAIEAASSMGLDLPVAEAATSVYEQASAVGFGPEHTSAVSKLYRP